MKNLIRFIQHFSFIRYELIGLVGLLILYFGLSISILFIPGLSKILFDKLLITYDSHLLIKYIGFALFLLLYEVILSFVFDIVTVYVNIGIANKMKEVFTKKVLNSSYQFFQRYETGFFVKRIIEDTDSLSDGISNIIHSVCNIIKIIVIGVILNFIGSWLLTFYYLLLGVSLIWTIGFTIPCVLSANLIGNDYTNLYSYLWEVFPGIKTIKLNNYHNEILNKVSDIHKKFRKNKIYNSFSNAILWQVSHIFPYVGYVVLLIIGLSKVENGQFTIGTLFGLFAMLWVIYDPLQELFNSIGNIQYAISASSRIKVFDRAKKEKSGNKKINLFKDKIEFKNVTFSYDNSENILNDFNLLIEKGSNVALVGHSGCGKTTVIHLLLKLFGDYNGEIMIDGVELGKLNTRNLRSKIAYVSQDSYMHLGSTLKENIDFSMMSTDSEIHRAVELVNLTKKISSLKNGIYSNVNDGMGFSGGELQRLCLLRAITSDAEIIILDEVTSALDPKNETKIINKLFEELRDKTIISIAHRENFIQYCDKAISLS